MSNKALATVQILDALGNPIPKIHYQVRNQKTDQHVVKGITNSKGCFYEIQRDKGTVLDVYVKNLFDDGMKKVKSFTLSKDRMLVKVISPKLLIDLKTLENNGKQGGYKRKTHIVHKGDTLTSIAQKYQTTVRALDVLNKLENRNKISIGQIIKLPVNTPATGNKSSQDKKPQPIKKQPTNNKPQKSTPPKQDAKKADESSVLNIDDYKNKALEKLNEWYEDSKKALIEAVKIEMKEDRSQDGGTPKTDAPNLCKSSPQCISSGQSELIREINIRLAGFGGALPTDKFTPLTEACIKQFQRDYMGVPETGKICGTLLSSLDKFRDEYGISKFMESFKCPCGKCSGFGKARSGTFTFESFQKNTNTYIKVQKTLTEPKGMHRSLIWGLKAMEFYFSKKENPRGYKISGISSGYRCVDNNLKNRRATVNHLGTAIDIIIRDKNNEAIDKNELENHVRKEWFCKYLNAAMGWLPNQFGLEKLSHGATSWVHLDIREFSNEFKDDNFFSSSKEVLNGDYLINIFKKDSKLIKVLGCAGLTSNQENSKLSDSSLEELIKKLGDVIAHGEGNYESYNSGTKNVKDDKVGFSFRNPPKGTVTSKTINQIIANAKEKDGNNKDRLFATGKYQTTYYTLQAGIDKGYFTGSEVYDVNMQEKVFREFLISKRSTLYEFVRNGKGNLTDAQYDAAQEWASVAVPKGKPIGSGAISNGKKSYYEKKGQNSSSDESTKKVIEILTKIQSYHANKKKV